MEGMISQDLSRILEKNRTDLNRLFEEKRLLHPSLRPDEFLLSFALIAEAALCSLDSVKEISQDINAILKEIYTVILDFCGTGLVGSLAKYPLLEKQLEVLVRAHPAALSSTPEQFLRSAANALITLLSRGEQMTARWTDLMVSTGTAFPGYREFLELGFIAAWLSGMAEYRERALDLLEGLPPDRAALILGTGKITDTGRQTISAALRADPWIEPRSAALGELRTTPVFTCSGGHALFGGPFRRPPVVGMGPSSPRAVSEDGTMEITCDRFGVSLIPVHSENEVKDHPAGKKISFNKNDITVEGKNYPLKSIENLSGHSSIPDFTSLPVRSTLIFQNTVYITLMVSCRIYIIALPVEPA